MPTKKRKNTITEALIVNADKKALTSAHVAVKRITFFRPQVSAKNPQKCELTTIPRNAIDEISPCSVVVICKSQNAYGKTKAMLIFSIVAPINAMPVRMIMSTLNRPFPSIEFKYSFLLNIHYLQMNRKALGQITCNLNGFIESKLFCSIIQRFSECFTCNLKCRKKCVFQKQHKILKYCSLATEHELISILTDAILFLHFTLFSYDAIYQTI